LTQRCLIIADDLTGGADAGAQFARRGLSTRLILLGQEPKIDFFQHLDREALVISTHSRGLPPEEAFRRVSLLLDGYPKNLFSVVYKKIDSTLRGNIGYETDAILKKTGLSLGFVAPAFPEQGRIVVGGIHLVKGRPLSLTEISSDAVSPVRESYVKSLIGKQSTCKIGNIDLIQVASGGETLKKAIDEAHRQGIQILIFDAVTRGDLAHIAEAAFKRDENLLFVGSAGLAEEVALKLASMRKPSRFLRREPMKPVQHVLVVSGSASRVTHEQLDRVEQSMKTPSFRLDQSFLRGDRDSRLPIEERYVHQISRALIKGTVILKTTEERMFSVASESLAVPLRITESLGRLAASALEKARLDVHDLVLVLFGGDTALSVLNHLHVEWVEIEGEVLKGIVTGHVTGGRWQGLRLITKAGAFGKENALEKILKSLHTSF
jgi:uncharacterized protein YgbK (DUF1537 family)